MPTPPVDTQAFPVSLPEGPGALLQSRITPMQVFNSDAKTAQNDPDDPYSIWLGDHANDVNVIHVTNPGCAYLQLALLVSGATAPTTTTFGAVRVFGSSPVDGQVSTAPSSALNSKFFPSQYSGLFDPLTHSTLQRVPDPAGTNIVRLWVPCYSPVESASNVSAAAAQNPILSWGEVVDWDKDATTDSGRRLRLYHNNKFVYIGGLKDIIVTVSTACATPTAAMVVGWFTN